MKTFHDHYLKRLINMMENPEHLEQIRKDREERYQWKLKSYNEKLEYWKNKSGYIVDANDKGFKAYAKNSVEGKKLMAKMAEEQRGAERLDYISNNPLDAAFDDICCGENPTSKIEVRAALQKYTSFTIDKFTKLLKMIADEGIDIK